MKTINSAGGTTCWSGAGTSYVTLYRVTQIDVGSRGGSVTYDVPGGRRTVNFSANDMVYVPQATVRVITLK